MPVYEFYCEDCHTVFSFFSKRIDTETCPKCPKCKNKTLDRQVSLFSFTGKAKEEGDTEDLPFDESKMEKAMQMLTKEADSINEDNPRQAADLMRKLTDMTGMQLGQGMEEALKRMERGEDPDQIEAEMGDLLEGEEPFLLPPGKKGGKTGAGLSRPFKDETLYDLHPEN
ncbi:MAG: FmdB family zinc ribbon protein [Desulfococcaceae bacterium]|jgi:putative FmdB family regulatory protein|nr:FmdB family zinc ribbon protein [Desulfococcaceae bacterium]